jgi:hypothetical protein
MQNMHFYHFKKQILIGHIKNSLLDMVILMPDLETVIRKLLFIVLEKLNSTFDY